MDATTAHRARVRGESVLLLAGYGTDPARLHPLRDALRGAGAEADIWPYQPVGSVAAIADDLAERVGRLDAGRVHLVGHSFGGIVCADTTVRHPEAITSVTTINTPWRGTWVSYTGSGVIVDGLRWRSSELADLRARVAAHHREDAGPRWLLVSAMGDVAVTGWSALRIGARGPRLARRAVAAKGHTASLLSPRLIATVSDHVVGDRVVDIAAS